MFQTNRSSFRSLKMKVKVSVYHGPSGSGRTDLSIPFVPGKTTVGQALEDAASRLANSGGVNGESGTDENGPPPILPNLTLTKTPSKVEPVTSLYIGQDWIKNRVPKMGSNQIRYHVVPALVSSDEDSEESDGDSAVGGSGAKKGTECELRMVSRRYDGEPRVNYRAREQRDVFLGPLSYFGSLSAAEERRKVFSSRLFEYHALEGIMATAWSKIKTIRVPIDDASSLRLEMTETGEIQAAFREDVGKKKAAMEELDLVFPISRGGATFADLKSVGKWTFANKYLMICLLI